ncbi:unnamed protein product [Cylicocyclus nassatus]|uniref:Uncharacterized protein n=1 Tax=Cylicocyclus nassatus TaxID=53992 RepID=A0AA36DKY0_CYLNA|nr:unnamed protein product [Cylicocyclus nassatus]
MSAKVIIFIPNAVLNTLVILLDILVIWAAIKTRALYRNRILHIITTAMLMDIAFYINFIVHDVPSFALERDFTLPFLTKYCGYKYYLQGHYWYFDFEKPYTYIYAKVNVALQGLCVATVIAADTAIMWKVIQMRSHATARHPLSIVPGAPSIRLTYGREARLALNFVMLSVCFLIMTVSYNVILGDGLWQDIITKFTLLLNLAKLAIYALETPVIRSEIINLIGCCKNRNLRREELI